VPGDAEHVPLDAIQQGGRQDDPGAVQLRAVLERQQRTPAVAEHLTAERDDVTAEDVAVDREPADLIDDLLRRGLVLGADLDTHRRPVMPLVGPLNEQDQRDPSVPDEVQAALHARQSLTRRASRAGDHRRAAQAQMAGVTAGRLEQLGHPEIHVPEIGQAHQLMLPAVPGEPGVQAGLHVDLVVTRPRAADRRERRTAGTKMAQQQPLHRWRVLGPRGGDRPAQQPPGQPPYIGQLRPGLLRARRPGGRELAGIAEEHARPASPAVSHPSSVARPAGFREGVTGRW
jgi:hypothetical protein